MPWTGSRRALLAVILAVGLLATGSGSATASGENVTIETTIDCETGNVTFTAPAETRYTASVTLVNISATSVTSSRVTKTTHGNTTFTTGPPADVVAAFASPGMLGDNATVSEIRYCGREVGTEDNTTDC